MVTCVTFRFGICSSPFAWLLYRDKLLAHLRAQKNHLMVVLIFWLPELGSNQRPID